MLHLIDKHGKVHPALVEIAKMACLIFSDTISLEGINAALQANWISRKGFRYQIEGKAPTPEQVELLRELGCIDAVHWPGPVERWCDGALLMGTTLPKVQTRLEHLVQEHRTSLHFKTVYLLWSNRLLNPEHESVQDLHVPTHGLALREQEPWETTPIIPTTEIEMMRWVMAQSAIPKDWNIIPVPTPDVPLDKSRLRPANTGETFGQWQKQTDFVGGRFVIASNQPFVAYQETNARRILPPEMELYAIGPSANQHIPLAEYLDTLAKQFYEEFHLRKLRAK